MPNNYKATSELVATGIEMLGIFIVSVAPIALFVKFVLSAVMLISEAVKIVRKHAKSGALNHE